MNVLLASGVNVYALAFALEPDISNISSSSSFITSEGSKIIQIKQTKLQNITYK